MSLWTLKSFVLPDRRLLVSAWYEAQDEKVQAAFETTLKFLSNQPPAVWERPRVGKLRKECKGFYEIRFEVNNVQHRPIGYYSGRLEFTIIAFAVEKGGKFDPLNICVTAKNRKAIIDDNKKRAHEFHLP